MERRMSFILKVGMMLTLVLWFGSANLFAESQYNVYDGWTLVEYSNGIYGLNDDNRGICYDISISSNGRAFRVCVGDWIENQVTESAIKSVLEAGLKAVGIGVRYANIAASAIVRIFEPSPAY